MAPAAIGTEISLQGQAKAVEEPVFNGKEPDMSTTTGNDNQPKSASSPTTSSLDMAALKTLRLTESEVSELPFQLPHTHSTFHVYHKKKNHFTVSPSLNPLKERFCGPTIKESREKRKQKKLSATLNQDGVQPQPQPQADPDSESQSPTCVLPDDGAFFLHTPYLAFKDPPRVLYTGSTKHAQPAALIHGSLFWRKWRLQLGPTISEPGVLDPRGVVAWRHNGGDEKTLKADDALLEGYKVRTWCRLWGETGKRYVLGVKANRKAGVGLDPDNVQPSDNHVDGRPGGPGLDRRTRCEEVVYLEWTSPFSRDTRRYHFQYGGVEFQWKGTATVKENHMIGWWCRYNHLKLVARVPMVLDDGKGKDSLKREICLGKYTSSVAIKKSGKLELHDAAIWRLVEEYMPSVRSQTAVGSGLDEKGDGQPSAEEVAALKGTPFYHVLISTAMCMVIGEYQKRETIRKIIEALLTEGAGGAAG